MAKTHLPLTIALVFCLGATALADRALERSEVLAILQKLTASPTTTWIRAGTIQASHYEDQQAKTTSTSEIDAEIQRRIDRYNAGSTNPDLSADFKKLVLDAIPFNTRYDLTNHYTMNSNVTIRYDDNRFYWDITVTSRTDSLAPPANQCGWLP